MTTAETTSELFEQYRGLLFSIAYRMLGTATDAEDVVQEAFLRWMAAGTEEVRSPRAYLSAVVVRLCIDQLRSARAQREVYMGPWLPEPIPTAGRPDLTATVELAESLSFAFLVMLESLKPVERAVFLLREVFDYGYGEIAEILGKSEAACRQIFHRAQDHLGRRRPRFPASREQQERLTRQFMHATTSGDMQGLLSLLAEDAVFTGDGGGKVATALRPVVGADKVARGMLGGLRRFPPETEARFEEINGQLAVAGYVAGQPVAVAFFEIEGDRVHHVYMVTNPDKLHWLGAPPG